MKLGILMAVLLAGEACAKVGAGSFTVEPYFHMEVKKRAHVEDIDLYPTSFDVDVQNKRIFLPDNVHGRILVFEQNEVSHSIAVGRWIRKIRHDRNTNSLFVLTVPDHKIRQYTLDDGELVRSFDAIIDGNFFDFVIQNDNLFSLFEEIRLTEDGSIDEYYVWRHHIPTGRKALRKLPLRSSSLYGPLNYSSYMVARQDLLYFPSEGVLYAVSAEGLVRHTFPVRGVTGADGLLTFDGSRGLTAAFDGPLIVKLFDLKQGVIREYNLVPKLEEIFQGVFGKTFMFGIEGNIYDVKYYDDKIYLMGSNKTRTLILRITLDQT